MEKCSIKGNSAFTLIELLVVVLIIGILAAVALPQYQKAVKKARLSEVLVNLNTLEKAVDLYLLEKGIPADTSNTDYMMFSNSDLNVEVVSQSNDWRFFSGYGSNEGEPYVYARANKAVDGGNGTSVYIDHLRYLTDSKTGWNTKVCAYFESKGKEFCDILETQGYEVEAL